MKKILVISPEESLAKNLQSSLEGQPQLFYWKRDIPAAQVIFTGQGSVDYVFVDSACLGASPIEDLRDVVNLARRVPVYLMVDGFTRALESDALLAGVEHVIEKPIRGDVVAELMTRSSRNADNEKSLIAPSGQDFRETFVRDQENRMLQIARNFIEVPRFAGSTEAACSKTLSLLRDMTGYRRIVLYFLRKPSADSKPSWNMELSYGTARETLDKVALTTHEGLGAHLISTGQIVQHDSVLVEKDPAITKVFKTLQLDAVIPVMAENTLMGMVMLGGRVTGEPLNRQELLLFYYLLENLGLYLKRPGRASARPESASVAEKASADITPPEILPASPVESLIAHSCEEMPNGYMLVSQSGAIPSANKVAKRIFKLGSDTEKPDAADKLPSVLKENLLNVFEGKGNMQPVVFRDPFNESMLLRCRIFPVPNADKGGDKIAGVFLEEIERGVQSESGLPLTVDPAPKVARPQPVTPPVDSTEEDVNHHRRVYDKLARQIHYSLVPLSTHAQLLQQGHFDDDFRESLSDVMDAGILRFSRFSRQLSYMVRKQYDLSEKDDWKKLVEGAFDEAAEFYSDPTATFEMVEETGSAFIRCEEVAIRFALSEIFLNALQASKGNPQFLVKVKKKSSPKEPKGIEIVVRDMGDGFEEKALSRAFEPFFSTRPAGLGLGLTVAEKVIEGHLGSIQIRRTPAQNQHEVVVLLPYA